MGLPADPILQDGGDLALVRGGHAGEVDLDEDVAPRFDERHRIGIRDPHLPAFVIGMRRFTPRDGPLQGNPFLVYSEELAFDRTFDFLLLVSYAVKVGAEAERFGQRAPIDVENAAEPSAQTKLTPVNWQIE